MTVQDLIEASARECGALFAGRTLATGEYANSIIALNALLGQLSIEGLTVFSIVRDALTLTGATAYTIGTGATFNTARPEKIRSAAVIVSGGSMPCQVVSPEKFSEIIDRTVTGAFADFLCCDYAFPTANIYLWPAPASGTLELFSVKPLAAVANLSDTISFPPGYETAIKYNLAVVLATELPGAKLTDATLKLAETTKAAVGAMNAAALGAPGPPRGPGPQRPLQATDIEQQVAR
jgi:hypothetical protein